MRASNPAKRMRYMVIERYRQGPGPVYSRFSERGRMLPPGLSYVDSWVDSRALDRCFQLMEAEEPTLLAEWLASWSDIVDFDVVPVIDSAEAEATCRRHRRAGVGSDDR